MKRDGTKPSPSAEIAYTAVMCALLIGGQYVFSFVTGVEIVTLLLACFAYVFGVRDGVICATAFSLLRCFIFGFHPTAIILYLIYYPAFAALFGGLGHIKQSTFENYPFYFALIVNAIFTGIAVACALLYAFDAVKISRLYKITVNVLLWVIFAISAAALIAYNCLFVAKKCFKKNTGQLLNLFTFTGIAAVCTVTFTLLDDVITPLFYGYSKQTALAYFYSSFLALLPQTVCTAVTVGTLFLPLTELLKKLETAKL